MNELNDRERLQVEIIDHWFSLPASKKNRQLTQERLRVGMLEPDKPTIPQAPSNRHDGYKRSL